MNESSVILDDVGDSAPQDRKKQVFKCVCVCVWGVHLHIDKSQFNIEMSFLPAA